MTLWNKGGKVNKLVESYTVGNDYELDKNLLFFDCQASIAHAKTLAKAKILTQDECSKLVAALKEIQVLTIEKKFTISQEQEDCHTAIEEFLTEKLGGTGKKIHTARSRNDQVLAALRLYELDALNKVVSAQEKFISSVASVIKSFGQISLPGYTHTQKAMPNTVKQWLGAFLVSAQDNLELIAATKQLIDTSPLGSAAGFGTASISLDNKYTAQVAGFGSHMEFPTYAQHSRGKFEAQILSVLSTIMFDINKLATDLILFLNPQFGYVKIGKDFCTGSSIMPQKYNPDVLELARAQFHVVNAEEFKIKSMMANLISGYHRDLQLTKEPVMKSFDITISTLDIISELVKTIEINEDACQKALTPEVFATQEAYELIAKGIPFRDAYKEIGKKYSKQ